jgi:hypothetical protein
MPIGILRRRRMFSAIYAFGDHLYFRVDRTEVDLADPTVSVRKTKPFPFLRRLTIRRGTDVLLDMRFRALLMELWEYPHEGDFFSYVMNTARNRNKVVRAMIVWGATSRGANISDPESHRRLEEEVAAKLLEQTDSKQ